MIISRTVSAVAPTDPDVRSPKHYRPGRAPNRQRVGNRPCNGAAPESQRMHCHIAHKTTYALSHRQRCPARRTGPRYEGDATTPMNPRLAMGQLDHGVGAWGSARAGEAAGLRGVVAGGCP